MRLPPAPSLLLRATAVSKVPNEESRARFEGLLKAGSLTGTGWASTPRALPHRTAICDCRRLPPSVHAAAAVEVPNKRRAKAAAVTLVGWAHPQNIHAAMLLRSPPGTASALLLLASSALLGLLRWLCLQLDCRRLIACLQVNTCQLLARTAMSIIAGCQLPPSPAGLPPPGPPSGVPLPCAPH